MRSRRERIVGLATGFGALHVVHTALNLAFTLVQLLVLARGLDQSRYAEIVFLTAVGFYVQPIDQAIGRANYMALRPGALGVGGKAGGEIFRFLGAQAVLLTVLSFLIPAWFGLDDPVRYLGNALYLFGCLFTAYWSFDLQSTVWSADLGRQFAFISIIRRLLFIAALGLFWTTGSFLLFGIATTVIVVAFMAVLIGLLRQSPIWALRDAPVTQGGITAHWKRFWSSLVFALSELLVLNSPYAVVTALLGVGPALVMFDSVMKVCRLAMAGTRTLAEIFLPRISRQLSGGRDAEGAARPVAGDCALRRRERGSRSGGAVLRAVDLRPAARAEQCRPGCSRAGRGADRADQRLLPAGHAVPQLPQCREADSPCRAIRLRRRRGLCAAGGVRAEPSRFRCSGSMPSSSRRSRSSRSSARPG